MSTTARYENEITNIDNYQTEEQRRYLARQTQAKMSHIGTLSEHRTSQQTSMNKLKMSIEFDNLDLITTEKMNGNKSEQRSSQQQPKQPKKEKSLTKQSDEVKREKDFPSFRVKYFSLLNWMSPIVIHRPLYF